MNALHVSLFFFSSPEDREKERERRRGLFAVSNGNAAAHSQFSLLPWLLAWIDKKSMRAFLSVWTRVSGMSNRGLLRVGPAALLVSRAADALVIAGRPVARICALSARYFSHIATDLSYTTRVGAGWDSRL